MHVRLPPRIGLIVDMLLFLLSQKINCLHYFIEIWLVVKFVGLNKVDLFCI